MKRTAVIFALTIFSMALFLPLTLNMQAANAQTSYNIQHVDHTVSVLYSGNVVIAETIQLTGTTPETFQIGLPFKYSNYILKGTAYDSNFNVLEVTLGVQLQDQSGFYAASVNLPQGTSKFTVVFILANGVLTTSPSGYNLDFPAYPSLTQAAAEVAATITLPSGATLSGIDKEDGVVNATSYSRQNLPAFTYAPAIGRFSTETGTLQQIVIPTLNRQIGVSSSGAITVTDTYRIVSNSATSIPWLLINLPLNASNIAAKDQFGRVLSTTTYQTNSLVFVQNVTLAVAMNPGETTDLSLAYTLPSVSPGQSSRYVLNLDLFPYFNYFVNSASVTVTPPEGATIVTPQLSQIGATAAISRNAFQETVTINKEGVSYIDSIIPSQETLTVTFDYSPLWIAFRPTSWVWAIVIVGIVLVALWTRPKTKAAVPRIQVTRAVAGLTLSPENLREFVESYEEKLNIMAEIRSLEAKADHGRIPRRRYKVQRKTLEQRLEALSSSLGQLKAVMSSAGGTYADIVRQLEAAEVEAQEVELSLKNIEIRHESGEIGLESYRNQLTDLEKRKEKAEHKVNGLLQRVRAEIR
jgi:hypothetical protein